MRTFGLHSSHSIIMEMFLKVFLLISLFHKGKLERQRGFIIVGIHKITCQQSIILIPE